MRLTDIFMDLLAYVTYFNKSLAVKQPSYHQVKADITRLMSDIEIRTGQTHIAPDDFEGAVETLKAWNVRIDHGPVSRPTGRGIYFYDPDGFLLEIRCDPS